MKTCAPGYKECTTTLELSTCRLGAGYGAPANFWDIRSCHDICFAAGWDYATRCGVDSSGATGCFCHARSPSA